jgi:CheY-like chemotaxis protein
VKKQMTDIGVVMMLTFPDLKRKPELENLGRFAWVLKPFGTPELEQAISRVLGLDPIKADPPLKTGRPHVGRALNILVAEDTPFNQKFILRLLQRWNCRARLVENGRQTLNALQEDRFDVILMDIQMPEINGLEVARRIREREKQSGGHIPIIAMTAHAVKGDRERCLEAGMDDYVSKPIDAAKLSKAIERLTAKTDKTSDPTDTSGVVDPDLLLHAFDGDTVFFKEVVEVFLSDYPCLLDNLRRAQRERNGELLMRSAHSLKGMLKNFQADAAAGVAFELEDRGRAEVFEGVQAGIDKLADQILAVAQGLRRLLEQPSDRPQDGN